MTLDWALPALGCVLTSPALCAAPGPCSSPSLGAPGAAQALEGELALSPGWAANGPPPSGPGGHQRVIRAAASSVCRGARDPDQDCSLCLHTSPHGFPQGRLPLLTNFLNFFCGLIDDFVIRPESASSCCLFPRYNLPLHCLPLNVIRGAFVSGTFSCFCN